MKTGLVKFLGVLEKGFVVLALLLFTDISGTALLFTSVRRGTEILTYGIYPISFLLMLPRWKQIIRIAIREKLLWVFIGLVLLSVLWSAAPEATVFRSFILVGTTLFGVYLAARYSLNEQLRLVAWALGIAALLSFLFALAFPEYGIMHGLHEGAWQGVTGHKNALGRYMVLSALVFLLIAPSSCRYRWLLWAGFGLSVSLLLLSTSKTAMVILLTLLTLLPLYKAVRWSYTWMLPFAIAVVLVGGSAAILLISSAETIFTALGRDITLTGRTALWAALLDKVWEHPWLGYGYGGFWLKWQGESANIWLITGWTPPHAHNGFLDILIALGFVGLLVFLVILLTSGLRAVVWVRSTKSVTGFWPLMYLSALLLLNLTETTWESRSIFWALYIATLLSTHHHAEKKTFQFKLKI